MLKSYRRRFVASTMFLITLVLLITLAAQFVVLYRSAWDELRNTMMQVIGPWERPGEGFRALQPEQAPEPPEGGTEGMLLRDRRMGRENSGIGLEKIVTVFYDPTSDTVSIMERDDQELDSAVICGAVQSAVSREESFGVLRDYGLIYFREAGSENVKLAFADVTYLRSRLLKSFLGLLLVFVLAEGLFLLISVLLSKRAARPMEQAVEMERQFVADISHDLKTPITVVLANNSILRSDPEARVGDQLTWIDSTDTAARNMMQLVEQMLTLSSLEAVGRPVELKPVDLSHIAEKCALQLESLAYDRGISLQTEIPEDAVIHGDREYAERICSGLVENALKYEPDGGRAEVTLERQKKKVLLRVSNAGSVISPEDLPHIFERFYRGDKTRNQIGGHGLGLPIIRQMTELLGGEIRAESTAEKGTVFTVSFAAEERPAGDH